MDFDGIGDDSADELVLARSLHELKEKETELRTEKSAVTVLVKEKTEQLIACLVENGKRSTGHIDGVGNFTIARSIYASVPAYDLPRFIDTLRGTDDFGMVKETIASPTLKKFLKEKIEETTNKLIDDPDLMEEYGDEATPAKVAFQIWEKKGVKVFDEMTIRHLGKGT